MTHPNVWLMASYAHGRAAARPAGDPIPQFRYDPATDRMVQIGTVDRPHDNSWLAQYPGTAGPPQPGAGTTGAQPIAVAPIRPAGLLWTAAWGLLATASMAASAYHGVKRNDSIGWGVWWGFMGSMFPVITPAIALAQGFGVRARS